MLQSPFQHILLQLSSFCIINTEWAKTTTLLFYSFLLTGKFISETKCMLQKQMLLMQPFFFFRLFVLLVSRSVRHISKEEQHCIARDVGEMVTNSSVSGSTFPMLLYWLFTGLILLLSTTIDRKKGSSMASLVDGGQGHKRDRWLELKDMLNVYLLGSSKSEATPARRKVTLRRRNDLVLVQLQPS